MQESGLGLLEPRSWMLPDFDRTSC